MVDKYNTLYIKNIDSNKDKLIEAFVNYYGEEYRIKISNKINEIIFTWFRHKFLDEFYEKYGNNLNNGLDIKYFLDLDINEVIGSTKDINSFYYQIKDLVSNSHYIFASNITFFNNNNSIEVVNFPIFLTTDKVLIHEINHVVVRDNMFYIDDCLIRKDGLEVDSKYSIFEEIINELSARDITNIFHNIGGSVFNSKFEIGNDYEKLFPIVEPFYNKYKDLLKRVRISINHNELYKYIDKDVYDRYINFINKVFYIKREYDKTHGKFVLSDKVIDIAKKHVLRMEKSSEKKLKLV